VTPILQSGGSRPTDFAFRFRCGGRLFFAAFALASPAISAFIVALQGRCFQGIAFGFPLGGSLDLFTAGNTGNRGAVAYLLPP
jgi:hypothetical protein